MAFNADGQTRGADRELEVSWRWQGVTERSEVVVGPFPRALGFF